MWEQLTPADIQRVKQRLAAQRIATLTRHMEELKSLDGDRAEIETFERLVAAFAKKHLIPTTAQSSPSTAIRGTTRGGRSWRVSRPRRIAGRALADPGRSSAIVKFWRPGSEVCARLDCTSL